ncbi:DeoR/GlpR family DNA-binding transcription regulator [Rhizobium sp. L1K21]|uniref:DeoR/GlpR family DNA-binding transcription regulator n=1 Tax=Rhizobium sp. L1K21 TaxID=2954933 RepID=UPI00209341A0|nr:DeoR/GlpR family DNA-binding transcription regulator [Rhizobium sp. L1K21]MCO6185163.1 DeoR/GlpR family DNA-binding transcription regulator [Rhizobium sp. L1K21]
MDKIERQTTIIEDLSREPALRVNELARRYDVSSETIRRDLSALTDRGLINRTYGGALRIISHEPAVSEREHIQVAERELIARMAVDVVEPSDVLMIGGGITTRYFAKALALFKGPLTVVTPSFHVALALGTCDNISVHMLPGEVNGHEGLVQGADTIEALSRYRATKAFLGASGLSEEGPSDAAIPAGRLYQTMMERALHTYVLADSSKFNKEALFCYARWQANVSVITDTSPESELDAVLKKAGTALVLP